MTNKSTKPLNLVEGGHYRMRGGGIFGPASKSTRHPDYPWVVGNWTYTNNGGWLMGREDERDLVARVPSPKARPAKKPRAKRVPTERSFSDMDGTELCVRLGTSGVIFGRHGGYQKISHKTARALGEYLSALADRSGK